MVRAQIIAEPRHHDRHALEIWASALQIVQRRFDIGGGVGDMAVLGRELAGAEKAHDIARLIAELGGAGDQRDGAHHPFEPPERAHHLERELRNAVAEIGEREALKHHIGEAAISRHIARALARDDERIRRLALGSGVKAQRHAIQIERLAVGPDARDTPDRPGAEADREIGEIAVGGRVGGDARRALAACGVASERDDFLKLGRPDHLTGKPCTAVDARDRRAFGRGHHVEVGKAWPFDLERRPAEQRVVDDVAADRTRNAAGDRARGSKDRAARGGACDGENKCGHQVAPGNLNA